METAENFIIQYLDCSYSELQDWKDKVDKLPFENFDNILDWMQEFAKEHVREALETAANNAYLDEKEVYNPDYEKGTLYRRYFEINRESITNAYSEDNIK